MHPLERRILATLRAHELAPPGSRGLVCVSGGADSLALLHLLHAAQEPLALRLEAVHFDHGLRPESAAEADWVARQVAALGLPCHGVRATHLAGRAGGVQAAARAWRRAEALRLAAQWEARWIATGHQRGDQAETLLLKWLRGAHLTRLRGMAWRDGPWVRPLLDTPREALSAYLRARGQTWLEDPTNRSDAYQRNRVRHALLPLLDALAPGGIAPRLAALEAQSAQAAALVDAVLAARPVPQAPPGHAAPWIDAEALRALPRLAAATALHAFVLGHLPGALDAAPVERALHLLHAGAPAWSLHLSHRRRLERRGARLLLREAGAAAPAPAAEPVRHALGAWQVLAPPGWRVAQAPPGAGLALHNLPPRALLELRRRRPGDRFHPPWKPHPVKLAAFLRDQHVPLWERERLPLVLLEGQVIAVYPRFVARGYDVPGALPDAAPAGDGSPLRLEIGPA
jgi:tRNA(Ile)-lysidine synthase